MALISNASDQEWVVGELHAKPVPQSRLRATRDSLVHDAVDFLFHAATGTMICLRQELLRIFGRLRQATLDPEEGV
jgi:hypothetical protein